MAGIRQGRQTRLGRADSVLQHLLGVQFLLLGIGLLVLAAVSYIWLYRVVVPNYAAKEHPANLKTNMSVAFQYVKDNPEQYNYILSINPAFAAKYELVEVGNGEMQLKRRK